MSTSKFRKIHYTEFNNVYLNNLVTSLMELREMNIIPISLLKQWFQKNAYFRYRLYEERKTLVGFSPVEDMYPSDISFDEQTRIMNVLSCFDSYARNFVTLSTFVKIADQDDLFEKAYHEGKHYVGDNVKLKQWLIKYEETFFKVFLFGIDYAPDIAEFENTSFYSIYFKDFGGTFRFSSEDFKGLTKFWEFFNHYFFEEELNKESEHYIC